MWVSWKIWQRNYVNIPNPIFVFLLTSWNRNMSLQWSLLLTTLSPKNRNNDMSRCRWTNAISDPHSHFHHLISNRHLHPSTPPPHLHRHLRRPSPSFISNRNWLSHRPPRRPWRILHHQPPYLMATDHRDSGDSDKSSKDYCGDSDDDSDKEHWSLSLSSSLSARFGKAVQSTHRWEIFRTLAMTILSQTLRTLWATKKPKHMEFLFILTKKLVKKAPVSQSKIPNPNGNLPRSSKPVAPRPDPKAIAPNPQERQAKPRSSIKSTASKVAWKSTIQSKHES